MPFNALVEQTKLEDRTSGNVWFPFDETKPLSFFAGLRTHLAGHPPQGRGPLEHELYAFVHVNCTLQELGSKLRPRRQAFAQEMALLEPSYLQLNGRYRER